MEVDEIQRQVCKFQRVSSNGSTTTTDNSSNPNKIDSSRANLELQNHVNDGGGGGGVGGGGGGGIDGVARLCGWPSSRIVRVSRASGGKDRHSKVLTSKGLRDRRVRLSVGTAIQFYDLQDRLGYDQPSKAVEWLLKAASGSIDELPSLDLPFHGGASDDHHRRYNLQISNQQKSTGNGNGNGKIDVSVSLSQAKTTSCSSASETSKGSELSLSRSENRMKARDRARERAKTTSCAVFNEVNCISENSPSFTDLLTGGINSNTATTVTTAVRSPMEYYYNNRSQQTSHQLFQPPQFNITTTGDNLHHFSFLHDSFLPPAVTTVGGGEQQQQRHNLNFSMTSPSSSSGGGGAVAPGGNFTRGTLQSNLPASLLPHHHHQRTFQSSSVENPTNQFPFFIVPNTAVDHFQAAGGGYHFSYGGGGDDTKEKSKN